MTCLPIVERELRVGARQRATFWLRVVAALVALVIGAGFLLVQSAASRGHLPVGALLFAVLTWLSFGAALSAGLFCTSDCLSAEKRAGTLGLLFLTDLRGYDVVLGKLLATSLRCAFALLAIFPVLALTQLLGGVAAGEFWKKLLALVHALFFSLAAGMFVSALSRDSQKALTGTLVLLAGFLVAGPGVDGTIALSQGRALRPLFSLLSPGYVFVATDGWGGLFWRALLTSQAVAWLLLGSASWLIRHAWQEKAVRSSPVVLRWRYCWKYGGGQRRTKLRRELLGVNPVMWLACRDRWQSSSAWVLAALELGAFAAIFQFTELPGWWAVWSFISGAVMLVFCLWMASQASQFFVEARRTGLVELLLSAPLRTAEIVHGPWRALVRAFAWPVAICLAVNFTTQLGGRFGGVGLMSTGGTAVWPAWWVTGMSAVAGTVVTLANLVALAWFGLWMGMTSNSARFAALKTIVVVQLAPWLVIAAAAVMIPAFTLSVGLRNMFPSSALMPWFPWLNLALTTGLSLTKDFFFVWIARRQLLGGFREMAARTVTPVHVAAAPPVFAAKS